MGVTGGTDGYEGMDFPLDSIEPMQSMEVGNETIAPTSTKVEPSSQQQQQSYNCFIPACDFVGTTPEELEWHTNSYHFGGGFFDGEFAQQDYLQDGDYLEDGFDDLDDASNEDDEEEYDSEEEERRAAAKKRRKKRQKKEAAAAVAAAAITADKPKRSSKYLVDADSNSFLCNHCDFTSARSDHLLRHTKRSHNERHSCLNCSRSFSTRHKMESHGKKNHPEHELAGTPAAEQLPIDQMMSERKAALDIPASETTLVQQQYQGQPVQQDSHQLQQLLQPMQMDNQHIQQQQQLTVPEASENSFPNLPAQELPPANDTVSKTEATENGACDADDDDNDGLEEGEFIDCPECSQYFMRRDRLELHAAQMHGPDSVQDEDDDDDDAGPALASGESENVICQYCGSDFPTTGKLKQHVNKMHEPFACPKDGCTYRTTTQELIDDHFANFKHESIKREPVEEVQSFRCRAEDCNFQGVTKEEVVFHVRVNHAEMKEDVDGWFEEDEMRGKTRKRRRKNPDGTPASLFLCDRCNFQTSRKDHLRRHIQRVHDKLKPHGCPSCDHKFFSKYHMQIHFKAIHENCKELCCPECDFKCNRKDNLNTHIRSNHNDGSIFMCTLCSFRGDSRWSLERHMTSVHTELQTFQCVTCQWTFDRKDRYEEHVRREHQNIQDTECVICGFKAKDKSEYEQHLRREHKRTGDIKCPGK
jgi:hypothetical protein